MLKFRELKASEIEVRIQSITEKGGDIIAL